MDMDYGNPLSIPQTQLPAKPELPNRFPGQIEYPVNYSHGWLSPGHRGPGMTGLVTSPTPTVPNGTMY